MLQLQIDKKTLKRFKKFIAPEEMKFIAALTLTKTAVLARNLLRARAEKEWNIKKRGVLRGFSTRRATKRHLVSEVGHFDWYTEQQIDVKSSTRRPLKRKNLAIPLPGVKRTKKGRISAKDKLQRVIDASFKRGTGTFVSPLKGKNKFLIRRRNLKTNKIVNLYLLLPKQRIKPKFSILSTAEKAASAGQRIFNRNITKHKPR